MQSSSIGLVVIGVIVLFHSQVAVGQTAPTPQELDRRIQQLRTGNVVVQVVDDQKRPIAGASVQLSQTRHHFEFGTALSTHLFHNRTDSTTRSRYLNLAKRLFNATVHENALKWNATEPEQGKVNYSDADRMLAWSEANGMSMRGHTLFWEEDRWNQDWLKTMKPAQLRTAVRQRATDVCHRYRGRIREYDVLNEMLHWNFFRSRLGPGIVKDMFQWCNAADPVAQLYVNDFDILNGKKLDAYVRLIRSLLSQGVPIQGIGAQGHLSSITSARIQKSLDTLAQFKLPVKITEFDAQAATEQEQAQILTDLYRTAFAHPIVTGIYMWGFLEGATWKPNTAIFRRDFSAKPAAKAYLNLVFHQWWTQLRTQTDRDGKAKTRAFFGQYRVTASHDRLTTTQAVEFTPTEAQPKLVTVVLK